MKCTMFVPKMSNRFSCVLMKSKNQKRVCCAETMCLVGKFFSVTRAVRRQGLEWQCPFQQPVFPACFWSPVAGSFINLLFISVFYSVLLLPIAFSVQWFNYSVSLYYILYQFDIVLVGSFYLYFLSGNPTLVPRSVRTRVATNCYSAQLTHVVFTIIFLTLYLFQVYYFILSLKIYLMKSGMLKYPGYYNIPYNINIYFRF